MHIDIYMHIYIRKFSSFVQFKFGSGPKVEVEFSQAESKPKKEVSVGSEGAQTLCIFEGREVRCTWLALWA
jgi:hypothetical protein